MPKLPAMPRPEYPRPQLVRRDWLCLNGRWQFEIDQGDSGLDRGLLERPLRGAIIVPFCPESKLSGVGNTDYLNAVWYRREVTIPRAWRGRRILLIKRLPHPLESRGDVGIAFDFQFINVESFRPK